MIREFFMELKNNFFLLWTIWAVFLSLAKVHSSFQELISVGADVQTQCDETVGNSLAFVKSLLWIPGLPACPLLPASWAPVSSAEMQTAQVQNSWGINDYVSRLCLAKIKHVVHTTYCDPIWNHKY